MKQSRQNKGNEMRISNTKHDSESNWLELEGGLIRIPYTSYVVSDGNVRLKNYEILCCSLWHEQAEAFLALVKQRGE